MDNTKQLSDSLLAAWSKAMTSIEHKDADLRFWIKADIATYKNEITIEHDGSFAGSFHVSGSGDIYALLAVAIFEAIEASILWSNTVLANPEGYDTYQYDCATILSFNYTAHVSDVAKLKIDLGDSFSINSL